MNPRKRDLSLIVLVALLLSGCSAAVQSGQSAESSGGAVELAVSETCSEGSDPQCVSVDGQYIVGPSAFESATVEDAAVAESDGQNAVDVTFTDDGTAVFNSLTEEAAQAGKDARLVVKIGDEIRAAVTVKESLIGDSVTIVLSPDDSAQTVVDLINND